MEDVLWAEELCTAELTLLVAEEELDVLVLLTVPLCTLDPSELVREEFGVGFFSGSVAAQPENSVAEQISAAESIIDICFFANGVIDVSPLMFYLRCILYH